jgi:amino acid transporter
MSRVKKEHRSHFHQHTQEEEEDEGPPNATWVNAFLLGIAMKLGGCTIAWNYGLVVGFWGYFMAVVVIGCGYAMLGLCMSEMISIMSFSGGYYGYARCAIGPFPGYIVGCCGIMESVFSMSMSVLKIGQFFTLVFELDRQYEILWWFLTFGFVICSHAIGAQYFWYWIAFIALSCLTLVFIYLFGSHGPLYLYRSIL